MSDNVKLPSKKEIAQLPRWAQVAFAARCARRVQPLFKHFWPDASAEHVEALDRTITISERGAARAADDDHAYNAAANAANAADTAAINATTATTALAAAFAAAAARAADDDDDNNTARAADAARAAAARVGAEAERTVLRAMRIDFEELKARAVAEQWIDDTPVPPSVFGPLWPEGEPEFWPATESESEPLELVIELEVPDGVDDDEVAERVSELLAEMDGLHRAMGGGGLKIAGVDVEVFAGEGVRA